MVQMLGKWGKWPKQPMEHQALGARFHRCPTGWLQAQKLQAQKLQERMQPEVQEAARHHLRAG